jgi:hypothetical protein
VDKLPLNLEASGVRNQIPFPAGLWLKFYASYKTGSIIYNPRYKEGMKPCVQTIAMAEK